MYIHSKDLTCTAFLDYKIIANGSLEHVMATARENFNRNDLVQLSIFDDSTGKMIDVDWREDIYEIQHQPDEASVTSSTSEAEQQPARRAGRPKLGVVSGEVTLLPRHWEWLKSRPGGASVTLRKLIDEARHATEQQDRIRQSQEATYRFMTAMAGDFPHYEEALRALYAGDSKRFYGVIDSWEPGISQYIKKLSASAFRTEGSIEN